jgi:hypothetical protein
VMIRVSGCDMLEQDITRVPVSGNAKITQAARNCFPETLFNAKLVDIPGPVLVQVLEITNISKSKFSAIQELEEEMGTVDQISNTRRVTRKVQGIPEQDNEISRYTQTGTHMHKLVLQDIKGTCAYGMELQSLGISMKDTSIGLKIILRNVSCHRGVVLLSPANTEILGGSIPPLDTNRREKLLEQLKQHIKPPEPDPSSNPNAVDAP